MEGLVKVKTTELEKVNYFSSLLTEYAGLEDL